MSKLLQIINKAGTIRGLQMFQLFKLGGVLLTGILFTKSSLTIREIGIYESLVFISTLFSFFWINGILQSLLGNYSKSNPEEGKSRLFNTGILIVTLNMILVAVLWSARPLLAAFLPPEAEEFYPLLLLYVLFNNPSFLIEYRFLLSEKATGLFLYGITSFILQLLFVAGPAIAGYPFVYCIYGLIFISALKNLYLLVQFRKVKRTQITPKSWPVILFSSAPLILSFLISGSSDYIDGILISTQLGSDALALYRYGARELPLAVLLASSVTAALLPVLSNRERFEEGIATLRLESARLMHFLFPVSILLMLSSSYLYPLIFRAEFIQSAGVFNIYLLLIISRVFFPQAVVMAHGRNDIIFKVALAEITMNVVASFVLLQFFGMNGVAWGTVLAFFLEKTLLFIFLRRRFEIGIQQLLPVRLWVLYSTILIITYLFTII